MKRLLLILFLLATVAGAKYPVWGVDTLYIYTYAGESTSTPRSKGDTWTAVPKWYLDSLLGTVTTYNDSANAHNGRADDTLHTYYFKWLKGKSYIISGSSDTSLIDALPLVGPGNWLVIDGKRGAIFCGKTDSIISTAGLPWYSVNFGLGNVVEDSASATGGMGNAATGYLSHIGGGYSNVASGRVATIAGGSGNTASGINATVGGGNTDIASGLNATVGGGYTNTASGIYATVGGGWNNTASGKYATIPGGLDLTVSGDYSFATGVTGTVTEDSTAAFCHQRLIVNGDTNATGATLTVNGDGYFNGDVTADTFRGDGSLLTGIVAGGGDSTWLTINATDSAMSAKFIGPLTGNVTGDVSGSSDSCTGNAATASNAALLQGRDSTDFDNAKTVASISGLTADSAAGAARLAGLAGSAYVPKTDSVLLTASSGRVSWNLANGGSGFLTMPSACTLNLPTGLTPGRIVTLTLIQDGATPRLAAWASGWKFCGDTATTGLATAAPTLTVGAGTGDVFTWLCAKGYMIFLGFSPAVLP